MTWSANDTRVLSSLMSLDNGQFSSMRNALCELTPFKRLLRADLPRVLPESSSSPPLDVLLRTQLSELSVFRGLPVLATEPSELLREAGCGRNEPVIDADFLLLSRRGTWCIDKPEGGLEVGTVWGRAASVTPSTSSSSSCPPYSTPKPGEMVFLWMEAELATERLRDSGRERRLAVSEK